MPGECFAQILGTRRGLAGATGTLRGIRFRSPRVRSCRAEKGEELVGVFRKFLASGALESCGQVGAFADEALLQGDLEAKILGFQGGDSRGALL